MSSNLLITADSIGGPRPVVCAGAEVVIDQARFGLSRIGGHAAHKVRAMAGIRWRQSSTPAPGYDLSDRASTSASLRFDTATARVVDVPAHAAAVRQITRNQATGVFGIPAMTKRVRASALERSP